MEEVIVPSKFYGIAAGQPTIFIGDKNGEIPRVLQQAQCDLSVENGQTEESSHVIQEFAGHFDTCLSLGMPARAVFDQRFGMRHAMNAEKPSSMQRLIQCQHDNSLPTVKGVEK